jgi:phosphoribosyl-AMP cyclohydrolase
MTSICCHSFDKFRKNSKTEASAKAFISFIQDVFQNLILGTVYCSSQRERQWSKGKEGIVIDNVQVPNQTKRIISNTDKLIEVTTQDGMTRNMLKIALQNFSSTKEL